MGKDALKRLPELCAPYRRILLVADEHTWVVCGQAAFGMVRDCAQALVLSGGNHVLVPDEAAIEKMEAHLPEGADPGETQMLAMLRASGFDMAAFHAMYGGKAISDGVRYAKDLKDRYTVLWLFDRYHAPIEWA